MGCDLDDASLNDAAYFPAARVAAGGQGVTAGGGGGGGGGECWLWGHMPSVQLAVLE